VRSQANEQPRSNQLSKVLSLHVVLCQLNTEQRNLPRPGEADFCCGALHVAVTLNVIPVAVGEVILPPETRRRRRLSSPRRIHIMVQRVACKHEIDKKVWELTTCDCDLP